MNSRIVILFFMLAVLASGCAKGEYFESTIQATEGELKNRRLAEGLIGSGQDEVIQIFGKPNAVVLEAASIETYDKVFYYKLTEGPLGMYHQYAIVFYFKDGKVVDISG